MDFAISWQSTNIVMMYRVRILVGKLICGKFLLESQIFNNLQKFYSVK